MMAIYRPSREASGETALPGTVIWDVRPRHYEDTGFCCGSRLACGCVVVPADEPLPQPHPGLCSLRSLPAGHRPQGSLRMRFTEDVSVTELRSFTELRKLILIHGDPCVPQAWAESPPGWVCRRR